MTSTHQHPPLSLSYITATSTESHLYFLRTLTKSKHRVIHIATCPLHGLSLYRHYKASLPPNYRVSHLSTFDSQSASGTLISDFSFELLYSDVVVLSLDMKKYDSKLAEMVNRAFLAKKHEESATGKDDADVPTFLLIEVNSKQLRALAREEDPYISTSRLLCDFWRHAHVQTHILYDLTVLSMFQSEDLIHIFDLDIPSQLQGCDVKVSIRFLRLDGEVWKDIPLEINGTVALDKALESAQVLCDTLERQKVATDASGTNGSSETHQVAAPNAYILTPVEKKSTENSMWNEVKNLIRDIEPLVGKNLGGEKYDLVGRLIMDRSHPHYHVTLTDTLWFARRYLLNDLEIGAEILLALAVAQELCEVVPPGLVLNFIETEVMSHVQRISAGARPAVYGAKTDGTQGDESTLTPLQKLQQELQATASHLALTPIRSTKYNLAQGEKIAHQFELVYSKWQESVQSLKNFHEPTAKVQSFIKHLQEVEQFGKERKCDIFLMVLPFINDAIVGYFIRTFAKHNMLALSIDRIGAVPQAQDVVILCSRSYYDDSLRGTTLECSFKRIYFHITMLQCMQDYFETHRLQMRPQLPDFVVHLAARYQYSIDRLSLLVHQKEKISDTIVRTRNAMYSRKRKAPEVNISFPEEVLRPKKRQRLDSTSSGAVESADAPFISTPALLPVKVEKKFTVEPPSAVPPAAGPLARKMIVVDSEQFRFPDAYGSDIFSNCQTLLEDNPITLIMMSVQNTFKKAGVLSYSEKLGGTSTGTAYTCTYTVTVDRLEIIARGRGRSKKEAKGNAMLNFMRLAVETGREKQLLSKFPNLQAVRRFVMELK